MFKNYIVIAWRNFIKHRTFSLINIIGFSLAMASCFLIVFHIQSELSYEKNFPKHENIYRVHLSRWAKSSPPLAAALLDYYPEIKSVARFYHWGGNVFEYGDYKAELTNGYLADSSAIDMFDLQFIKGSAANSLRAPYTMIITESVAKQFFNNEDPVGKMLTVGNEKQYPITGVIKDLPETTHLKFDFLVSFSTFYKEITDVRWTSNKGWMAPYTYALIEEDQIDKIENRKEGFLLKFYEGGGTREEILTQGNHEFQPIKDIHLHSHLEQEMSANSNANYLYIFGAVAIFIVSIASVNFINLNISMAFRRMKETGMRKAMGAVRSQLIRQYLTETFLTSFVSFILALALFFAVLPNYNSLSGRAVQPGEILTVFNFLVMTGMIITVSLISGLYPALFISKFTPIDSLKSQKAPQSTTSLVRKALVVFQFSVSVFMIASTIVIFRQMKFFEAADLGFNKDEIVAVRLYGELQDMFARDQEVVKTLLRKNPDILQVGACSNLPGQQVSVESVRPEGADPTIDFPSFRVLRSDYDFVPALQLQIISGRNFSPQFNDSASFLINEKGAKALNLAHPVGSKITNGSSGITGTIVGVIKDFHFTSLHNAIEPMMIQYKPGWSGQLIVKIKSPDAQATISNIEQSLRSLVPSNLFSYSFVDEQWNNQYREENKMSALFNAFSLFMIGISCIGLFGLSAIAIENRRKEIGIRKVVGANIRTIITLLSREFVAMVVIGSLIAMPVAGYVMNAWLQKFQYRIYITADVFVITFMIAVTIAFSAVLVNALKAAMTNPVESLRSE